MSCDCRCWSHLVFLKAEHERLEARLDRLERDVARESVDRQDGDRSVRDDVLEPFEEFPIPYTLTSEGRVAALLA